MDITLHYCMYYNKPSYFNPGETSLDAYRTALTGRGGKSFKAIIKKELKYIKSLFAMCPSPVYYGFRMALGFNTSLGPTVHENQLKKLGDGWELNGEEFSTDKKLVLAIAGLLAGLNHKQNNRSR